MSYVQGTTVRLEARFEIPDPAHLGERILYSPDEVVLTVRDPAGAVTTYSYTEGEVLRDEDGVFSFRLDTAAAPGTWLYQFENNPGGSPSLPDDDLLPSSSLLPGSPGEAADKVVERKAITVTGRLI